MILGMPAKRISALLATWNPSYKSAPAVLSLGDLRLTANTGASGTYASTRSTLRIAHLGYYSGTVVETRSTTSAFGVTNDGINLTNTNSWVGQSQSAGLWMNGGDVYRAASVIGTIAGASPAAVEIAVRISGGDLRVWFRRNGGGWLGGGDPAADTSPTTTISSASGNVYLAASVTRSGASSGNYVEMHATAGTTTGTVPSGFTAALFLP
jgi:hypothetical protein